MRIWIRPTLVIAGIKKFRNKKSENNNVGNELPAPSACWNEIFKCLGIKDVVVWYAERRDVFI